MNRKKLSCLLLLVMLASLLLPGTLACADDGKSDSSPAADAKFAVVRVVSEYADGALSFGSAFGVGPKDSEPEYFITNAHVVLGEDGTKPEKIYILLDSKAARELFDADGRAKGIDVDYSRVVMCEMISDTQSRFPDVALLKSEKPVEGRTTLPIVETSRDVPDASTVYALGFPGSMDGMNRSESSMDLVAEPAEVTLTAGVVSKKTTSPTLQDTDVIVHSASINSGNSGGPLIDVNGAVVAINTYSLTAENNQFVSIFADYARELLDKAEIEYATYGEEPEDWTDFFTTRNIVLLAAIAVIAVAAVALVCSFNKRIRDANRRIESIRRGDEEQKSRELRVQGVDGYFAGRRFSFDDHVSFGRGPDNGIAFPTDTPGVGEHHCMLLKNGDSIYIKDLNSRFGTFLNGSRLPPEQVISIRVGDRFSLGSDEQSFMITRKGGRLD